MVLRFMALLKFLLSHLELKLFDPKLLLLQFKLLFDQGVRLAKVSHSVVAGK